MTTDGRLKNNLRKAEMTNRITSMDELPEVASRAELAEYTGIAPQTLARWASEGTGPKYIKLGGAVRYLKRDLLEWLNAQSAAK